VPTIYWLGQNEAQGAGSGDFCRLPAPSIGRWQVSAILLYFRVLSVALDFVPVVRSGAPGVHLDGG
jgi:hypothetical protein